MKTLKLFIAGLLAVFLPIFSIASVEVAGSLSHKHTGKPGDIYTGTIDIVNHSDIDQEVKIYQTDFLFNYEGKTFYDEPESHNRSNAGWITYSPTFTILKAKEIQHIQYEVKIPGNDSLVGTYWSIIMVEGVEPIIPGQKGQLNINTTMRYGVQIVTKMGKTGIGKLRFMKPSLTVEDDNLFLDVNIENTGERVISPIVTAEFFDETGKSIKVFEVPKNGMYPTTSARFRFKIEGIEGKKTYQVLIIADGGDDDVFGLETTLNL